MTGLNIPFIFLTYSFQHQIQIPKQTALVTADGRSYVGSYYADWKWVDRRELLRTGSPRPASVNLPADAVCWNWQKRGHLGGLCPDPNHMLLCYPWGEKGVTILTCRRCEELEKSDRVLKGEKKQDPGQHLKVEPDLIKVHENEDNEQGKKRPPEGGGLRQRLISITRIRLRTVVGRTSLCLRFFFDLRLIINFLSLFWMFGHTVVSMLLTIIEQPAALVYACWLSHWSFALGRSNFLFACLWSSTICITL